MILALFLLAASAAPDFDWNWNFKVEEKDDIRKTLAFSRSSGDKQLRIDNITGNISITGYDGADVQVVAHRTIRAESADRVQTARQDVVLKLAEKDNIVDVLVDAPYRCENGGINYRGPRFYGYEVRFDFEIKVPRASGLWARTVNGGKIDVENISGKYDVENINGRVDMTRISGSGRVYALNGGVKVDFSANPTSDSFFGSLNGKVEVTFLPGLSADFWVKNMNGGIFTDFDVTPIPSPPVVPVQRENGKFVYKGNRLTGVRAGNGGPQFRFENMNGSIQILKRGQ